jgi:malonyl-CoA O-methyltransferase
MSAPEPLDTARLRARFERSARTYADAAVVQREVGKRLIERFDLMRIAPETVLDIGCGPGTHTQALSKRFPDASVIAIDQCAAMVVQAAAVNTGRLARLARFSGLGGHSSIHGLVCDMGALPLSREFADVLWSNFALQWANDAPALFAEWSRVMKTGGVVMFTAPGPDTLVELRRALSSAGESPDSRVQRFIDLHDIGDMLVHAGFADPVMDMEVITLEYASAAALWRDLRAQGATNTMRARPRGLLTPRRLRNIEAALDAARAAGGPIRISVEVIYGHAWKVAPRKTAEGHGIVRIDSIRRAAKN